MDIWHIKGGKRLEGTCRVQGSKNATLPIIAASIITPAVSELQNVPQLKDVDAALRILRHLGCRAEQFGNDVYIDSEGLAGSEIPHSLMAEMRSSVIFMGALIARCGEARLTLPGGCQLGERPIDLHLKALRQMGAEIEECDGEIQCRAKNLHGENIILPFPSVGATENIMLASTAAKGETVICGAAKEPEIVALQNYLRKLGAEISGAGTDTIKISGFIKNDHVNDSIIPDRIAASTLACAAAATGGSVEITGANPAHFSTVLYFLKRAGCDIIINQHNAVRVSGKSLKSAGEIVTAPYPGFPTDAQPVLMAALLRAKGTTLIRENIFENRYRQAAELNRLGADITVNGRTARITGVETLHGAELTATDLRGGAAMIIAGMTADGETVLRDSGHVSRGYEKFDKVLKSLGADIFIEC